MVRSRFLTTALVLLAVSAWADAAPYRLVEVAPLAGHDVTQAFGINEHGQLVGTSFSRSGAGPDAQAFLWTTGLTLGLGALDDTYSTGLALNDNGRVTGQSNGAAFLWDGNTMSRIYSGPSNNVSGIAINNLGQIVIDLGFIWQDGATIDAGMRFPKAINEHGVVAGHTVGSTDVNAVINDHGVLTVVDNLPDETDGGAGIRFYAINDSGQVVGHRSKNGRMEAFLWENGTLLDFGADASNCGPTDINNSGQVVGSCGEWAFIWDKSNGMRNLNDLVAFEGTLVDATGINDAGQIAAYGTNGVEYRAFLLSPVPEPTPAWLLLAGVVGFLAMRVVIAVCAPGSGKPWG